MVFRLNFTVSAVAVSKDQKISNVHIRFRVKSLNWELSAESLSCCFCSFHVDCMRMSRMRLFLWDWTVGSDTGTAPEIWNEMVQIAINCQPGEKLQCSYNVVASYDSVIFCLWGAGLSDPFTFENFSAFCLLFVILTKNWYLHLVT